MAEQATRNPGFKKFKGVKPKVVSLPAGELVRESELFPRQPLPLLVEPGAPDVDLVEWARESRGFLEERLLDHGAILFRGFDVASAYDFERFT
ncbi:MAG TPA: hypothetical protein VLF66_01195, partial [Thermoanaerobaculia bacterium]|nr:hypothetical protein [Thermoanaerobaculia bacterium]